MTAEKHTGRRLWRLHTKTTAEDGGSVLFVEGRLDHAGADHFALALAGLAPNGSGDATIDLSGVDYISSAGLKVIESASERMAGAGSRLRLRAPSVAARLALELAGLERLVDR